MMKLGLNDTVRNLIPKVEQVFLFDDDDNSILMYCCLSDPNMPLANIQREVGLLKLTPSMTAHISVYKMPNEKYCAVAYPCSVKVNYDKFDNKMRELFSHVNKPNTWSGNSYAFYLYCVKNGYDGMITKKSVKI